MSVVGTTSDKVNLDHSDPILHVPTSYSSVVAQSTNGPAIDTYIAAVHTDLKLKQSRQNNLDVTGLPDSETRNTPMVIITKIVIQDGRWPPY